MEDFWYFQSLRTLVITPGVIVGKSHLSLGTSPVNSCFNTLNRAQQLGQKGSYYICYPLTPSKSWQFVAWNAAGSFFTPSLSPDMTANKYPRLLLIYFHIALKREMLAGFLAKGQWMSWLGSGKKKRLGTKAVGSPSNGQNVVLWFLSLWIYLFLFAGGPTC